MTNQVTFFLDFMDLSQKILIFIKKKLAKTLDNDEETKSNQENLNSTENINKNIDRPPSYDNINKYLYAQNNMPIRQSTKIDLHDWREGNNSSRSNSNISNRSPNFKSFNESFSLFENSIDEF